ncbi:MAG: hypothetical protein WBP79_12900 [Candidatus Acidiferrales bacterium]
MAELFQDIRWLHIAAGSVALILFWIPVAISKGGPWHIRIGWTYAACMAVVVATALSMSGLAFSMPLRVRHFVKPLSADETVQFIRNSREIAFFLGYLGLVTLAAGWQGIGVLRTRRDPRSFRKTWTYGLNAAVVLAGIVSLTMGIIERAGVFVGMSSVGFLVGGGNLRYLLRDPESKMHWWYEHLSSMIATAIAGYTAFLAFGGTRLFPILGRGQFHVLLWLAPTLIGGPAISLTIMYYKRKFHENGRADKSASTQMKPAV